MPQTDYLKNVWTIILAGGEGQRLSPLIFRWIGRHKPKQYCTFVGTRSMFQHTLDRADQIAAPERKVIVAGQAHIEDVTLQSRGREPGKKIFQPSNRGTAAGIFVAVAYVRAQDQNATIVICPSDHFIYPEDLFIETLQSTVTIATKMKKWLFLLGVKPDRPEPDYGYIFPGAALARLNRHCIHSVHNFLEKPKLTRSAEAISSGALWNTFILVARVEALWGMGWLFSPSMMSGFESYTKVVGTEYELEKLEALYEKMPTNNFSSDLLQQSHSHLAMVELKDVLWCDWGRPERIVDTLYRIGRKPAFAPKLATTA
jgi:mannose-1-phosphate guanylyltransferase